MGRMTASLRASLAWSRPATSSHLIFGFSERIAPASAPRSFFDSGSWSSSSSPPLREESQWADGEYTRGTRRRRATYFPLPAPFETLPFAPTALGFLRLAGSCSSRWLFNFSARSMYSAVLVRIISFDLAFFSPARGVSNQSVRGEQAAGRSTFKRKHEKLHYTLCQ